MTVVTALMNHWIALLLRACRASFNVRMAIASILPFYVTEMQTVVMVQMRPTAKVIRASVPSSNVEGTGHFQIAALIPINAVTTMLTVH